MIRLGVCGRERGFDVKTKVSLCSTWPVLAACLAAAGVYARPVFGGELSYIETTIASGSYNGVAFSGAAVTLSTVADSNSIIKVSSTFYEDPTGTPTLVTVAGVGSGLLTDQTNLFVNQNISSGAAVGIEDFTQTADILDDVNFAFANYNLHGPIGPITGTPEINATVSFPTSAGLLNISSSSAPTFTATSIPEPTSLAGLVIGFGALSVRHQRRKTLDN